jgi:hypothetical protein
MESEIIELRGHKQEETALVQTLADIRQKREEELEHLTRLAEKLTANRRLNIQVSNDRVDRIDGVRAMLSQDKDQVDGKYGSGHRAQLMMSTHNLTNTRIHDYEDDVERMTALEEVVLFKTGL